MAYLSKSRFKEALECPDKLFYYRKEGWADNRSDNEFLQELAKSGIQVGELAKSYYPGGVEVTERDNEKALQKTAELLKQDQIILFEAAFAVDNLLVRVDIVIKSGSNIELIEVKSKSIFDEEEIFTKKTGSITSDWKEYVYDIAFQYFVVKNALKIEDTQLKGFLYLIDKNSTCTIDGLYQKYRLKKDGDKYVVVSDPKMPFGDQILRKVQLTEAIRKIIQGNEKLKDQSIPFKDYVKLLNESLQNEIMINSPTGRYCKACTYKTNDTDLENGLKSGYENCWKSKNNFNENDFKKPSVFEIWKLHHTKLDQFLSEKRYFLSDIKKEDLEPKGKSKSESKLPVADRQWLQLEIANGVKQSPYIDKTHLQQTFSGLDFPLHFIDFEVAMNAIPFLKGLRPYHQLAFQFSHHTLEKNGKVNHAGQWIETRLGVNPNLEFIRKLKAELAETKGSILIYSQYENSILLHLMRILIASTESDKNELIAFIKGITTCKDEALGEWIGNRAMIDMRAWVLDSYLSLHMRNSNSLKVVLPAIINDSGFLKKKYEQETYGSETIQSLNFTNYRWVNYDSKGLVKNPYKYLPAVFDGLNRESIELMFEEEELADGGAAMSAYNLMQFTEMTPEERSSIISALYKYCELDTLAMVMLYEGLHDLANR